MTLAQLDALRPVAATADGPPPGVERGDVNDLLMLAGMVKPRR